MILDRFFCIDSEDVVINGGKIIFMFVNDVMVMLMD